MKALIVGVTGQDGSLLAKHLLDLGYEVVGTIRRGTSDNFWRLQKLGIRSHIQYRNYNIGNELAFSEILRQDKPDQIYSLAGESFTALSFEEPKHFMKINVEGAVEQLEAIRTHSPEASVFFASSSEIFGTSIQKGRLNEDSPKNPKTPYGVSKLTQNHLVSIYRDRYHLKLFNGILFPHESPFRTAEFVTQKICRGLVQNFLGPVKLIQLGDTSMLRDWGNAKDFVKWFNLLLIKATPGDYVIGTEENTSVEQFLILGGRVLGIELIRNEIPNSKIVEYVDSKTGKIWARSDPSQFTANRFSYEPADASKLWKVIGKGRVSTVPDIVREMIQSHLKDRTEHVS